MLLETKAIIQFALLWGSTWVVASLAIASVLGMALVANFVVARREITRPGAVGVVAGGAARPELRDPDRPDHLREPRRWSRSSTPLLEFSPILCAGLLFGSAIKRSTSVARDYGTNLLGAMVGGVAEYASLVTGFRVLLVIIAACYIGAVLARRAEDRMLPLPIGWRKRLMPSINVALIGYAFMGKAHSNAYRQVAHFFSPRLTPRMKVICGRTPAKVKAAARELGWEEAATDWREVVDRDDIDLIDIATPGDSHAEIAIAAARAGKAVFCEKPLGNTVPEAERMLAAVTKAGVTHMICHNYRRIPAVMLAKAADRRAASSARFATTAAPTCRTGSPTRSSRWCGGSTRSRRARARSATSPRTRSTWPGSWSARSPKSPAT